MRIDELLFTGVCIMSMAETVAVFMNLPVLAEASAVSLITMIGLWMAIIRDRKKQLQRARKKASVKQMQKKRVRSRNAVVNVMERAK